MDPLALVMRILHIVPAVFLAGGILFMWSSLLPGIAGLDDDTRKSVVAAIRGKWAKIVMICSALLLASGLYNAISNIMATSRAEMEYATPYHAFVTLKLVLAIAVMFITARLSGRSESADKFREQMPFWMSLNTALVLVIILLGSTMKISEKIPKSDVDAAETQVELSIEQE